MVCKIQRVLDIHRWWGLSLVFAVIAVTLLLPSLSLANEETELIVPNKKFVLSAQEKQFIQSLAPLRVMIDDNFVPLSFYDVQTHSYQGISVDLFRHIAGRLGLKYELLHDKTLSWSDKEELFKKKDIDLLMPVSFTEKRAAFGIYTASFFETYYGVIAKKSNNINIQNTHELSAYKVGVTKAAAIISFIQSFVPANQIVQYDNQAELYQAVRNNQIDLALQNTNVFQEDRFNYGFVDLTLLHTIVESPRRYAYFLNKTEPSPQLASIIDRYLAGVDYSHLIAKYNKGEEELILRYSEQKHRKKLLEFGIVVAFSLLGLLAVVYINHRRFSAKLAANFEQQQRQKELLEKSEEKYRNLFDHSRDALMTLEPPAWGFSSGNQASLKMFQISSAEEFLSRGPWDLSPERQPDGRASAEKAMEMIETAIRDGFSFFEWTYQRGNGEEFTTDVLLTRLNEDNMGIILASVRDITERKQSELALSSSRKLLQSIINTAPIRVFWKDKDLRYLGCNLAFAKDAGFEHPDDLIGKDDFQFGWKDRADLYRADDLRVITSGLAALSYEELQSTPDGKQRWLRTSKVPLHDDKGASIGVLGIYEDITRWKEAEQEKLTLEQQFQQTQKLESLGVLSGGIAHDFNNILAVIIGYCGLTKMDYKNVEKNISEIEKAAERAAGLCRQMLAYAGKAQLAKTQVNMFMLVSEMIAMLKSALPQNAVIKPELAPVIPFINADASQLRQIVMNLIINAAEAIGNAQGEIRVALARTKIIDGGSDKDYHGKLIEPGEYVCLQVADNGCGMDEETKWRIFEPFYTTKFTGRGLGMSAVLGIIKSHGGALQLESKLGQGTEFRVYLPAWTDVSAEDIGLHPSDSLTSWHGCGTILLAEDEEQIRHIAKIFLEIFGFTVLEAANGKEALELYRKDPSEVTLVLTDMGMPVMDGYELFAELKKLSPELPIIVSSGFGDSDVSSRLGSDNLAGTISKPYRLDQLREVLKNALAGRSSKQI